MCLVCLFHPFAPPSKPLVAESPGQDPLKGSLPLHTTSQGHQLLRNVPGLVALGRKTPHHLTLILTSKVTHSAFWAATTLFIFWVACVLYSQCMPKMFFFSKRLSYKARHCSAVVVISIKLTNMFMYCPCTAQYKLCDGHTEQCVLLCVFFF